MNSAAEFSRSRKNHQSHPPCPQQGTLDPIQAAGICALASFFVNPTESGREFGLRSQALSSSTILQGATVNAAKMLRQDDFLGQIEPGFAADLLILNENPLLEVSILAKPKQHVLAVIKNGRVCVSRWSKLAEDFVIKEDLIE